MRTLFVIHSIFLGLVVSAMAEAKSEPVPVEKIPPQNLTGAMEDSGFTWEQVQSHIAVDNPVLNAAKPEVEAAKAGALQDGAYPNPALGAQFEKFAGTGGYQGTRSLETTVSLNQALETGGKRRLRRESGTLELKLAELGFAARRSELLLEARSLFWDILLAQETLLLEEEGLNTARYFLEVQEIRRKAGKVPLLEEERARTSLLNAELKKRRVEREASSLRVRLALLMSRDTIAFYRVRGNLGELEPLPSPDSLYRTLDGNQGKARSEQEIHLRQSKVALEKAKVLPDVELEAGWRYSSDISAQAVVAGLKLPLPLWDRNHGGIAKAQAKVSQAREEMRVVEGKSRSMLHERYLRLLGLRSDVDFVRDSLLPSASSGFKSAEEGFRLGRFSPLEILDARHSYLDARQAYLETLAEYHHLRLELEGLMTLGTTDNVESYREGRK